MWTKKNKTHSRTKPCQYCRSLRRACVWSGDGTCLRCAQLSRACSGPSKKSSKLALHTPWRSPTDVGLSSPSHKLGQKELCYALSYDLIESYRDDKKKRPHYEDPDLEEYRLKVVNCRGRISELPEAEELGALVYMSMGALMSLHSGVTGRRLDPELSRRSLVPDIGDSETEILISVGLARSDVSRNITARMAPQLSRLLSLQTTPEIAANNLVLVWFALESSMSDAHDDRRMVLRQIIRKGEELLKAPGCEGDLRRKTVDTLEALVMEEILQCLSTGAVSSVPSSTFEQFTSATTTAPWYRMSAADVDHLFRSPDAEVDRMFMQKLFRPMLNRRYLFIRLLSYTTFPLRDRMMKAREAANRCLQYARAQVDLILQHPLFPLGGPRGSAIPPAVASVLGLFLMTESQQTLFAWAGLRQSKGLTQKEVELARQHLHDQLSLVMDIVAYLPSIIPAYKMFRTICMVVQPASCIDWEELNFWMRLHPTRAATLIHVLKFASFHLVDAGRMLLKIQEDPQLSQSWEGGSQSSSSLSGVEELASSIVSGTLSRIDVESASPVSESHETQAARLVSSSLRMLESGNGNQSEEELVGGQNGSSIVSDTLKSLSSADGDHKQGAEALAREMVDEALKTMMK